MAFPLSERIIKIRAIQRGYMKPLIDYYNKEGNQAKRGREYQEEFFKSFEILFAKNLQPLCAQLDEPHPIEAIYLTIEYIYQILELNPPSCGAKKWRYYHTLKLFLEKHDKENAKAFTPHYEWMDGRHYRKIELVQKRMGLNLKTRYTKQALKTYVLNRMQESLDFLFALWMEFEEEYSNRPLAFIEKLSQEVFAKIKEEKREGIREDRATSIQRLEEIQGDLDDKRVLSYTLYSLKDIAYKAIKGKKLKLRVKDYAIKNHQEWKEWRKTLPYVEYERVWVEVEDEPIWAHIPNQPPINVNAYTKDIPHITKEKHPLGGHKAFEATLYTLIKGLKQTYLKEQEETKSNKN